MDATSFKLTKAADSKSTKSSTDQMSQTKKRPSEINSNLVKDLTKQPSPYFGPPNRDSRLLEDQKLEQSP